MSADSPIVEEVRERRRRISEQYAHDLDDYVDHLQEVQEQHRHRLVYQVPVTRLNPRQE